MPRRRNFGSLARATGGDIIRTEVRIDEGVVRQLDSALALGLFEAAKQGKERALDHASGMFKTTREFRKTAFAIGFDNGREIGKEGPRRDLGGSSLRSAAKYPVDPGLVSYFGYAWFVARFWETGTVKFGPRPSVSQAQVELANKLPQGLRSSAKAKGF